MLLIATIELPGDSGILFKLTAFTNIKLQNADLFVLSPGITFVLKEVNFNFSL